ncbi:DUF3054 domain-containing protein [Gordonia sp. VNK21]|uniref:DUF3054 domain-containing protein n=1 Tax=Gordonia sp. VNK21 TaxID=3382483 RepID=UPI0038D4B7B4
MSSSTTSPSQSGLSARSVLLWPALADVVAVLVFVAIGRNSHEEAWSLSGFATTAWPFLAGAAVGWLISAAVDRPLWLPARIVPAGLIIWVSTVVVGMLLRVVSDQGTALSFCIVASIATAVLLLGWRAIAALIQRRRTGGPADG